MSSITQLSKSYRSAGITLMVLGVLVFSGNRYYQSVFLSSSAIVPNCNNMDTVVIGDSLVTVTLNESCWSEPYATSSGKNLIFHDGGYEYGVFHYKCKNGEEYIHRAAQRTKRDGECLQPIRFKKDKWQAPKTINLYDKDPKKELTNTVTPEPKKEPTAVVTPEPKKELTNTVTSEPKKEPTITATPTPKKGWTNVRMPTPKKGWTDIREPETNQR